MAAVAPLHRIQASAHGDEEVDEIRVAVGQRDRGEPEDDADGERAAAPAGHEEAEVAPAADAPHEGLDELAAVERQARQEVEGRRAGR